MENRGALRFVAGTLPRQPNQRRQSACTRYSPRAEPCGHGTSSGSLNPTAKPDLPWRAVSPLAQQARRSESHHRDGPSARSTGLSNAEVWSAVRRQRCRVLRAKTPPTTNRVHQKEGCPTRPKGHTSPCMNPSIKKFLESRITGQLLSQYPRVRLKAAQELLESGLVLSWGDERGLFVAGAAYLNEGFGRKCSGIHFLTELKRDNGVLTAVDDQNGSVYFL